MKRLLLPLLLLTSPLPAGEPALEGEVWYDAEGEVAYVEGPAAAPVRGRFVPGWETREKERAARRDDFRIDHRAPRRWYGYPGWSVWRAPCLPPVWRPCVRVGGSGVSIILR